MTVTEETRLLAPENGYSNAPFNNDRDALGTPLSVDQSYQSHHHEQHHEQHPSSEESGFLNINSPKARAQLFSVIASGAFAYDFMTTFLTLAPYWSLLGGEANTFGFILGVYQAAKGLFSLVLGILGTKIRHSRLMQLCSFLLIVGNVLYFGTSAWLPTKHRIHVDNTSLARWLLIIARIFSGAGSAGGVVVLSYLTEISDPSQRVSVINRFRMGMLFGNMLSSGITIGLLYISSSMLGPFVVSGFTVPCLTSLALQIVVGLLLFALTPAETTPVNWKIWEEESVRKYGVDIIIVNAITAFGTLAFWMYYGQVIPICTLLYHIVTDVNNLWYPYISILVGAILGMVLSKRIPLMFKLSEKFVLRSLPVFMFAGLMFLFKYTTYPSQWLYYVGMAVFFTAVSTFFTVARSIYTKVIEKTPHISLLLGISFVFTGLAAFLGASLGGLMLDVEVPDDAFSGSGVNETSTCEIKPFQNVFNIDGCSMKGVNILVGVCVAITVIYFIGQWFGLNYVRSEPEEKYDIVHSSVQQGDDMVYEEENQFIPHHEP